jgi:hypothetical protein
MIVFPTIRKKFRNVEGHVPPVLRVAQVFLDVFEYLEGLLRVAGPFALLEFVLEG